MTTTPPVGLKLAGCPFCGGKAALHGGSPDWSAFVECINGDCKAQPTVNRDTAAEAAAAWNTRPVPAPAPEVGEKLAVTLYEAFWMRNAGIVAVAWDAQADAIRTMWRAIAADALADAAGPAKKGGE